MMLLYNLFTGKKIIMFLYYDIFSMIFGWFFYKAGSRSGSLKWNGSKRIRICNTAYEYNSYCNNATYNSKPKNS